MNGAKAFYTATLSFVSYNVSLSYVLDLCILAMTVDLCLYCAEKDFSFFYSNLKYWSLQCYCLLLTKLMLVHPT